MAFRRPDDPLLAVPLFADFSEHDLAHLHRVATSMDVPAGQVLMEQGSIGQEMVVVISGLLEVVRDGHHVADIGPGEVAGELALICSRPRRSTVVTKTDVTLVHIDGRGFKDLLEDVPHLAVKMLPLVAGRVPSVDSD
jgi:CRP-like cAMP-binding protein